MGIFGYLDAFLIRTKRLTRFHIIRMIMIKYSYRFVDCVHSQITEVPNHSCHFLFKMTK
jgi:hypothetical protein